jgi:hypothetical protein
VRDTELAPCRARFHLGLSNANECVRCVSQRQDKFGFDKGPTCHIVSSSFNSRCDAFYRLEEKRTACRQTLPTGRSKGMSTSVLESPDKFCRSHAGGSTTVRRGALATGRGGVMGCTTSTAVFPCRSATTTRTTGATTGTILKNRSRRRERRPTRPRDLVQVHDSARGLPVLIVPSGELYRAGSWACKSEPMFARVFEFVLMMVAPIYDIITRIEVF